MFPAIQWVSIPVSLCGSLIGIDGHTETIKSLAIEGATFRRTNTKEWGWREEDTERAAFSQQDQPKLFQLEGWGEMSFPDLLSSMSFPEHQQLFQQEVSAETSRWGFICREEKVMRTRGCWRGLEWFWQYLAALLELWSSFSCQFLTFSITLKALQWGTDSFTRAVRQNLGKYKSYILYIPSINFVKCFFYISQLPAHRHWFQWLLAIVFSNKHNGSRVKSDWRLASFLLPTWLFVVG